MSSQMASPVLLHFAFASQLSLGIVFLLSALPKLRRPMAFAQSVVRYEVLPAKAARVFALALIPLETILAIAFLTSWLTGIALPLATGMLMLFLIAVGINLKRGRKISCGCFGDASEPISARTLARLLLLLSVILFLIIFRSMVDVSLPGFEQIIVDAIMLIYLLQIAPLAAFLILIAAWILRLPEWVRLVRRSR